MTNSGGCADDDNPGSPQKRRGRPARMRWLSPADVARLLAVPPAKVLAVLESPARSSFFPRARQLKGEWEIAVEDLRPFGMHRGSSAPMEPLLRPSEFARLIRVPRNTVVTWLNNGTLHKVDLFGLGILRVPADEYWRLREAPKPRRGPRALSFFSGEDSEI